MKATFNGCIISVALLFLHPLHVDAAASGQLLPSSHSDVSIWWTPSSAKKVRLNDPEPNLRGDAVEFGCARNEYEGAQLVLRTRMPLANMRFTFDDLKGANGSIFHQTNLEVLQVSFLQLPQPSDKSTSAGWWPDPLLPIKKAVEISAHTNHVFWIRVFVPKQTAAGIFLGNAHLEATGLSLTVPLRLQVYGFTLPDRLSCQTAFGFSPGEVFRYHHVDTLEQKRLVLNKYLSNLAAHHVSPYDPAPLDPIRITWPEVHPPASVANPWLGGRIVTNEAHSGHSSLLVYDDKPAENVTVTYEPLISIPKKGFHFQGWYRTAVPGHRFNVSFNHYDQQKEWMSGQNRDFVFAGNGQWQRLDEWLTNAPNGAVFARLYLRATPWTDSGEHIGLVWYDELSLTDLDTGRELLTGGDFERKIRTELVTSPEKLAPELDFTAWDPAMEKAFNDYHFNSVLIHFPGLGSGTFHSIDAPGLLGFNEDDPEYELLLASYGRQMETHLRQRGWLKEAYIYWFDEPSPEQYPFVLNGFAKLKRYCPQITRMITDHVTPGLLGGPNLWCPISNHYQPDRAEERHKQGERFWWYVCTGPKAPYAGLFIDHPAPEMRIWLWQTWQRGIQGVLVWQLNYWTSSAAYPDAAKPQNPYEDPMSWTSGYSTPAGKRLPWGNGDGRFIYPPPAAASAAAAEPVLDGPVDSIRWEHLRDGLEDYEYFCLLRDTLEEQKARLSESEATGYRELLQVPEAVTKSMTEFAVDGAPIEQHRKKVAAAIESLLRKQGQR